MITLDKEVLTDGIQRSLKRCKKLYPNTGGNNDDRATLNVGSKKVVNIMRIRSIHCIAKLLL
jgi:hypothetical protein